MDTIDFILKNALRIAEITLCICGCVKIIRSLPKRDTVIEPDDGWCADDEDIII